MTFHRQSLTTPRRGKLHESADAIAQREELARLVWAQTHAERARRPAPVTRARQRSTGTAALADAALAHLRAGGCSGDFCPTCNGTGERRELRGLINSTRETCWQCNGQGMGK